jgi:long-chain acyl-CoA synthetase
MTAPIAIDGAATAAQLFRRRARDWAEAPALRHKARGIWYTVSWAEYYANCRAIGLALADAGCRPGDVVSVLAENRPEWLYADMGAQCMGLLGNGIYPTSSPEQVAYILENSDTRVVFVENEEQLDKVLAVRAQCPRLALAVVIDEKGLRGLSDPGVVGFARILELGRALAAERGAAFEAAIERGQPEDIAFLVYTSGTTGPPKGAMIAHANLMFQIASAPQYARIARLGKTLSFLPLCHIAERMGTVFNPLALGQIVHFPENSGTIFNDLREVAPHLIFGPPRFWEKLYAQVELFMQEALPIARLAYRRAIAEGRALAERRIAGRAGSWPQRARFAVLQRLALANLRRSLGLSNVTCALTGAAPVPPDLLKWYMAIGIDLLEAFGMTETTGFCTATPPERIRLGSAGLKAAGTEVRLGAENELLVRGPNVFAGYWKMPGKTAEAIDRDGWLHTGDCGAIDADGYIRIVDRLKDIIITSGGKNVSPSAIENQLKFSPYIADAVVIGEGRHYLTALVMVDQDTVAKYAQDRQVPFTDFASLTRTPEIVELVRRTVEDVNRKLARVEQVKQFRIIDRLLTPEDEELTPTMKLKRKAVALRYAPLIDSMYAT